MKLNEVFNNAPAMEIEQLSIDSRIPMKNAIFFCLEGIKYDGHNYIDEAIENGARVIIYSKNIELKAKAIYIKVNNVNETLFRIADIFYNHPNVGINEYVVSGCYGRSSVSSIIKYYLDKVENCGYVGIYGINYLQTHLSASFPALTPLDNLKVLNNMKKEKIKNCVFESSPISLYYKKLDVLNPNVFIYTDTSKYSSDYKVCNNYYFSNLRKYLYTLEDNTYIVFNGDDESFNELKDSVTNYVTYGTNEDCTYRISDIKLSNRNSSFKIIYNDETYDVTTKLISEANVYNICAAIAALNVNGYDIQNIIDNISDINYFDGVLERIDDDYNVIIDSASEADSLENIMKFARGCCEGKVIGLIGINYSDDDKRIKKIMDLCRKYLDIVLLTENESFNDEVMHILEKTDYYSEGINAVHIGQRSTAIENGINIMNKKDIFLILGKGNETYLSRGLGKERYRGDKYYALKYINDRKVEENEIS